MPWIVLSNPGMTTASATRGLRILAAWSVLLLSVAGCGARRTYPVEGIVRFSDGEPARELAGGSVEFESMEGMGSARGNIRADASYRMETQGPADGVAPGRYRVLIVPPPPPSVDRPFLPVMDPRFKRFDTSGLEVTVRPKKNSIPLKVDRPKGSLAR
jgi:hypothetical protein